MNTGAGPWGTTFFWNWREFKPEFRAEISGVLGGQRTAYVWGKL
ncbi:MULTISPECIES: hypothetical protein [Streptomyces]|nr:MULTISPECIES: hypothetical protein [Streptomyces]